MFGVLDCAVLSEVSGFGVDDLVSIMRNSTRSSNFSVFSVRCLQCSVGWCSLALVPLAHWIMLLVRVGAPPNQTHGLNQWINQSNVERMNVMFTQWSSHCLVIQSSFLCFMSQSSLQQVTQLTEIKYIHFNSAWNKKRVLFSARLFHRIRATINISFNSPNHVLGRRGNHLPSSTHTYGCDTR